MPDPSYTLAAKYAIMQRNAANAADDTALHQHIASTLKRCLPASLVTEDMADHCFHAIHLLPTTDDPMHTGAIHAWAGHFLLTASDADLPLLQRLHRSALRLLPKHAPATRDDLRLVTLDSLYHPGVLPPGEHLAFLKHRLGLNGVPRLSCEEIAIRMHQPLLAIHELECAILTILSNGGTNA